MTRVSTLLAVLLIFFSAEACSRKRSHWQRTHQRGTYPMSHPVTPYDDCPCVPIGSCAAIVRALHSNELPMHEISDCEPVPGYDYPRIRCCLLDLTPSPPEIPQQTPPSITTRQPIMRGAKPEPQCGVCGEPTLDQRIVGGKEASLGQFPWIARLGYNRGKKNMSIESAVFQCGGTLVSQWHVITAAHCVLRPDSAPQLQWVRLGEHDERTAKDCVEETCAPPTQDIRVSEWRTHPGYEFQRGFKHDLAVLKLEKPVNFTDYVRPICLPYQVLNITIGRSRAVVAGWGTTIPGTSTGSPVLMTLWKNIVDMDECSRKFKGAAAIVSGHICAGGTPGEDSCSGDSGGPLALPIHTDNNNMFQETRFSLLGIVSFGARLCGSNGMPGVYTYIPHYMDWITKSINDMDPKNSLGR